MRTFSIVIVVLATTLVNAKPFAEQSEFLRQLSGTGLEAAASRPGVSGQGNFGSNFSGVNINKQSAPQAPSPSSLGLPDLASLLGSTQSLGLPNIYGLLSSLPSLPQIPFGASNCFNANQPQLLPQLLQQLPVLNSLGLPQLPSLGIPNVPAIGSLFSSLPLSQLSVGSLLNGILKQ